MNKLGLKLVLVGSVLVVGFVAAYMAAPALAAEAPGCPEGFVETTVEAEGNAEAQAADKNGNGVICKHYIDDNVPAIAPE